MPAKLPVETFRSIMAPVTAIAKEAIIEFRKKGIRIHGGKLEGSASVTVTLSADAFTSYRLSEGKLGLNPARISAYLNLFDSGRELTLTISETYDKLFFEIQNHSYEMNGIGSSFVRGKELPIPATGIDIALRRESDSLHKAVTAADYCSQSITFQAHQERQVIECTAAGDLDDMHIALPKKSVETPVTDDFSAEYSVSELLDIIQTIPRDEHPVRFRLGPETPLLLSTQLAGSHGMLEYVQPPQSSTEP